MASLIRITEDQAKSLVKISLDDEVGLKRANAYTLTSMGDGWEEVTYYSEPANKPIEEASDMLSNS